MLRRIVRGDASRKLIQPLGKLIHTNRRKIRKNMLSSLVFLTYRG